MRVPNPPSLRIDRRELLKSIEGDLRKRAPQLNLADPTDPGVMLLEQAAWMVETLSERLNRVPERTLEQITQLLGLELQAARPAIGVVVLSVDVPGALNVTRESPAPLRFVSPATERSWATDWVPLEPSVFLGEDEIAALLHVENRQLAVRAMGTAEFPGSGFVQVGPPNRADLFDQVEIVAWISTTTPNEDAEKLRANLHVLTKTRKWLRARIISPEKGEASRVGLALSVDLPAALDGLVPVQQAGLAPQLHLPLSDVGPFRLELRYADLPEVPPEIRGMPVPSEGRGQHRHLIVSGLAWGLPVDRLLAAPASPPSTLLARSAWEELTLGTSLHARAHQLRYELHPIREADLQPWARAMVRFHPQWEEQFSSGAKYLVLIRLGEHDQPRTARVGLLGKSPRPSFWVLGEDWAPTTATGAWTLLVATSPGQHMGFSAWDVRIPAGSRWLLGVVEGNLDAAAANPILTINAPTVRDGRGVPIVHTTPELVTLLRKDIVTRDGVDRDRAHPLLQDPLGAPGGASELLNRFPIASISTSDGGSIDDWVGVGLDAATGELSLNAPDEEAFTRQLSPRTTVKLQWYRYTDGAAGNLPVGAIRQLQGEKGTSLQVHGVYNPIPTFGGLDREPAGAAIERLLASGGGFPIVPADFERLVRHALRRRGKQWVVRCWTASERRLLPWTWWSPDGQRTDHQRTLQSKLDLAGAETLLFVVGPPGSDATDTEMLQAEQAVREALTELKKRLPLVRDALVVRHWSLHEVRSSELALHGDEPEALDELRTYRDRLEREWSIPASWQILDGHVHSAPGGRAT